jgi:large subunit ribosomal protein L5
MSLQDTYKKEIIKKLMDEEKYQNVHQVPKLTKITLNISLKEALTDKKVLEAVSSQLSQISGQKPVITKAKKAIATFKLREKEPIGVMVTLRGKKMWDFFEKLIGIALPRVRDFQGVPVTSFDGHGNYSLGIKEQIVFPEIEYDKIDKTRGLEVTISTSSNNDEGARKLLKYFGMPFKKEKS